MRMRPDFELAKSVDLGLGLDDHMEVLTPAMFCWSRTIREAIGLPVVSLAQKLEISRQAATKLLLAVTRRLAAWERRFKAPQRSFASQGLDQGLDLLMMALARPLKMMPWNGCSEYQ